MDRTSDKENYLQVLAIVGGLFVSQLETVGTMQEMDNDAVFAPVVKFFHATTLYSLFVSILTSLVAIFSAITFNHDYGILVPTIYFSIGTLSYFVYTYFLIPMLFLVDPAVPHPYESYVCYLVPQTIVLVSFFVFVLWTFSISFRTIVLQILREH